MIRKLHFTVTSLLLALPSIGYANDGTILVIASHPVNDYAQWRAVYDGFADEQMSGGVLEEDIDLGNAPNVPPDTTTAFVFNASPNTDDDFDISSGLRSSTPTRFDVDISEVSSEGASVVDEFSSSAPPRK